MKISKMTDCQACAKADVCGWVANGVASGVDARSPWDAVCRGYLNADREPKWEKPVRKKAEGPPCLAAQVEATMPGPVQGVEALFEPKPKDREPETEGGVNIGKRRGRPPKTKKETPEDRREWMKERTKEFVERQEAVDV